MTDSIYSPESDDLRETVARWLFELTNPLVWEKTSSGTKSSWRRDADELLALLQQYGVVRLDENQETPKCFVGNRPRAKAIRDMLESGF